MIVILPWPSAVLSPNSRAHWRKKSPITKCHKSEAFYLAKAAMQPGQVFTGPMVKVTFCPPDNRRRDTDNMLASCKAYLDGVALAIGCDDSGWTLTIARAAAIIGGAVIVEIMQ